MSTQGQTRLLHSHHISWRVPFIHLVFKFSTEFANYILPNVLGFVLIFNFGSILRIVKPLGACRRATFAAVYSVIYADDADEVLSLRKSCPDIGAYRGGVENGECCKVINDAINTGGCACVCRKLKNFNHSKLIQDCNKNWCLRCGIRSCSNGVDGSFAY